MSATGRISVTRLTTANDQDTIARLYAEAKALQDAERKSPSRLGQSSEFLAKKQEYEEFCDDVRSREVPVITGAVKRSVWKRLKEAHPPRRSDDPDEFRADRVFGLNIESVDEDLLYESVLRGTEIHAELRATLDAAEMDRRQLPLDYTPPFTSRATYEEWLDDVDHADFTVLSKEAWDLNNTTGQVNPKALPSLSPTSAEK